MTRPGDVHVIVPGSIDDPLHPSGGNVYDRRVCDGLGTLGWTVHEHRLPGSWPDPDAAARAMFATVIRDAPDGAVTVIDGLIASMHPEVLVPASAQLRLVILVHAPLGNTTAGEPGIRSYERAVLSCADAIVTTSAWTRRWLLREYLLRSDRVHVAEPGVDTAALTIAATAGDRLLCVAAVTPTKGHDVLIAALASIAELPWSCVCVGSLDRDPEFVDRLGRQAQEAGIHHRIRFTGPLTGADLASTYASADLLVLASRAETYGMVVTEALARGIPVVATEVGGLPAAIGFDAGMGRPGLLVPPEDPAALADAIRCWMTDDAVRRRLRNAARERRLRMSPWSRTAARFSEVLTTLPPRPPRRDADRAVPR